MTIESEKAATATEVFPPMVPTKHLTVAGISGWWSILRTKPRCEKRVAMDLLEREISYFIPFVKRRDKHRNIIYAPLEYLRGFVFIASEPPPPGYGTPATVVDFAGENPHCYPGGFVPVRKSQQDTLSHELQCIFSEIVEGHIVTDDEFKPGRRCEVIAGPLLGKIGFIDEVGNGWAMMPISILERSVPTRIPLEQLRVI